MDAVFAEQAPVQGDTMRAPVTALHVRNSGLLKDLASNHCDEMIVSVPFPRAAIALWTEALVRGAEADTDLEREAIVRWLRELTALKLITTLQARFFKVDHISFLGCTFSRSSAAA
jgi:hypothetical protein